MRCLIIVDMQDDYFKDDTKYQIDILHQNINKRINEYNSNQIIYIVNKFIYEISNKPKQLNKQLHIKSNNIFLKRSGSCFSSKQLLKYLRNNNFNEIEIIGIDGNYCIKKSVIDGHKKGFKIFLNLDCIGSSNPLLFNKTKLLFDKLDINYL